MKKILAVMCIAVLSATALCAQKEGSKTDQKLLDAKVGSMNVTLYGDANGRFGMQSMTADNSSPWSAMLMSGLSGNTDNLIAFLGDPATSGNAFDAQNAFGTALVTKIMTAAQTGGDLSTVTGAEKELAASVGFSQTDATAIATAYVTAATISGMSGGDAAAQASAGGAAAAASYGSWAATHGLAMMMKDLSLAGYLALPDYTKNGMYYGPKNENAVKLGTKIASADGKFTADIAAKYTGSYSENPVDVQTAWMQYDLGPVAVKYNSHDGSQHWDSDILYVGDNSLQSSLDFQIKPAPGIGYAFFTVMSDESVTSGVKYFNTEFRAVPMMQAGYVYTVKLGALGDIETTVGGALDQPTKDGGDYLGYMGFGGAKWTRGQMASEEGSFVLGLNGLFGQNTSRLAGMSPGDMEQATLGLSNLDAYIMGLIGAAAPVAPSLRTVSATADDDSIVSGGRFYGGYTMWTGGIASVDARMSVLTFAGDTKPFAALRVTGGLTQFLSSNFSATLGGGYEQYSVQAGDKNYKSAHGYEITLDIGYRF